MRSIATRCGLLLFEMLLKFFFSSLVSKTSKIELLSLSSACSIADTIQITEVSKTERCQQGTMEPTNVRSYGTSSTNGMIELQTPYSNAESFGYNSRPNSEIQVSNGDAFRVGFFSGQSLLCPPSINEIYDLLRNSTEREEIFLPNI
jgi:hypothetical protein